MRIDMALSLISSRRAFDPSDLRSLRQGVGWSQSHFASQLGRRMSQGRVATATVSMWEAGKRRPRPAALRAMQGLLAEMAAAIVSDASPSTVIASRAVDDITAAVMRLTDVAREAGANLGEPERLGGPEAKA